MMASLSLDVRLLGDQPLGRGDEVVEHVLLLERLAGQVPLFAVLAAAAQVGHRQHAAQFHPARCTRAENAGVIEML